MRRIFQSRLLFALLTMFALLYGYSRLIAIFIFDSPTPQITNCLVRSATPLEIYQGAQFGITTHAYASGISAEKFRYLFSEESAAPTVHRGSGHVKAVTTETVLGRDDSFDYSASHVIRFESNVGLHWPDAKIVNKPLEVRLYIPEDFQHTSVRQTYKFDTAQIPLPDVNSARHANFKVVKARLTYASIYDEEPTVVGISLNIKEVSDEGQGSSPNPQCVGNWISNLKGTQPSTSSVTWPLADSAPHPAQSKPISRIDIELSFDKCLPTLPKGTIFHGLLSIHGGWPQEISVECLQKIAQGKEVEVKFISKLAPRQETALRLKDIQAVTKPTSRLGQLLR